MNRFHTSYVPLALFLGAVGALSAFVAPSAFSQDEDVSLNPASARVFTAPNDVATMAISPFGSRLAVGFKRGGFAVIDLTASGSNDISPIDSRAVRAFAFSADGALLAVAKDDGTVDVGPTRSYSANEHLAPHFNSKANAVEFEPDGNSVVVGYDNGRVDVWRLADSQSVYDFTCGKKGISVVSVDRAGEMLAALDTDGNLYRFDLDTGQNQPTIEIKGYDKAKPDWSKIVSASAAGYGQSIVVGFRNDWLTGYGLDNTTTTREIVKVVDVATGTITRTFGENLTDVADMVAVSDDATLAATVGEGRNKVRFWDVRRADIVAEPPFNSNVTTMAFGRGVSGLTLAVAAGKEIQLFPISLKSPNLPVDTLAVLDFQGDDAKTCAALADIVRGEVSASGAFVLLTRGNVQEALPKEIAGELTLSESGLVSKDGRLKIERLLAAKKLITGSVTTISGKYSLTLRLEDVETGHLVVPSPVKCDTADQLPDSAKALADTLLRQSL